ncbi:MAG TPA: phosphatase PAP2 family protein [Thermoanaerobaculia bacterium]|nr:phosphatase PAP2 family protein [Thermoanaerobaculia bacterium]
MALLAFWVPPAAAAREVAAPPVASAAGQTVSEGVGLAAAAFSATAGGGAAAAADGSGSAPATGNAAEAETASSAAPAPAHGDGASSSSGNVASPTAGSVASAPTGSLASPPAGSVASLSATSAASPADASAPAAPSSAQAAETTDGVSAGMPVWKLLVIDARSVFTAPAHWTGGEWALFGIGVAGVAGLTQADKHLRTEVLRGNSSFETNLANDFRPLGSYAAFGVLGAFYAGGLLGHDAKAQETALDGLIASGIAAGVITPILKEVVGRSRPSTHKGVYDFHPFSGNASFPSGESTEAFAAGSVIAAEYPHLWVEIASYGTASLVAFARMREDAHWASDVVAGALIGTTVGRAVVHLNRRLRARVSVAPLIAPGAQGLTIHTAF